MILSSSNQPRVIFKLPLSLFLTVALLLASGCGAAQSGEKPGPQKVVIRGKLSNCYALDSMRVFDLVGQDLKVIAKTKLDGAGEYNYSIEVEVPHHGLFVIGPNPRQNLTALVLLGPEPEVTFDANCQSFGRNYQLPGSASNQKFQNLMSRMNQYQQAANALAQEKMNFSASDPAQLPRIQTQLDLEYKKISGYLDSLVKEGGIMGTVATMYYYNHYVDYALQGKDEFTWFAENFFKNVNHLDEGNAYVNMYFEKAKTYASVLQSRSVPGTREFLDNVLKLAPEGSRNRKTLYLGYLIGLEQVKGDELYLYFGEKFIKEFPGETQQVAALNQKILQLKKFAVGSPAPEISLTTPNGGTVKLSDFKGKIVMLDFWASWCKPCRVENPNVVKAYNKYHAAGFEIFGVSLDNDKAKWMEAIQKDGLTWSHGSDLLGWQSVAAKAYEVSSIPATVLIDKEGKILARNLRGPALEEKLRQLFGF